MKQPHEWLDENREEIEDHDRGLLFDLGTLSRRRVLGLAGGLGLGAALVACTTTSQSTTSTTSSATAAATPTGECIAEVPDETAGPYPADGQSGRGSASVNVLDDSGIVRSDIRSSFGAATTTAEGVLLTIKLTVRDAASCEALVGAAVYLWHCDRAGQYSMYSPAVTGENYLRGVQESDSSGTVTFTSIFPACYSGRWPHIHFEVYRSVTEATSVGQIRKTSQIALPKAACDAVYATTGYQQSVSNLSEVALSTDNVFRDDQAKLQLATMSGDAARGYLATLTVSV